MMKFDRRRELFWKTTTCDEVWTHRYDPETTRHNMEWKHTSSSIHKETLHLLFFGTHRVWSIAIFLKIRELWLNFRTHSANYQYPKLFWGAKTQIQLSTATAVGSWMILTIFGTHREQSIAILLNISELWLNFGTHSANYQYPGLFWGAGTQIQLSRATAMGS